jgi:hypothetical protein
LPTDADTVEIRAGERAVRLTNLRKVFWPELGLTKRDLLQYYADVAPVLLPHLRDRAMVMKRYPNGASQAFFFMKRVPEPHPPWLSLCPIEHSSGSVIDFPVVQDLLSLLWVVNLGCIDLNQWYARCDDVDRPDYVHFDLDPVTGATAVAFDRLREAALTVRDALAGLDMPADAHVLAADGASPAVRVAVPCAAVPGVAGDVALPVVDVRRSREGPARSAPHWPSHSGDIPLTSGRDTRRPGVRLFLDSRERARVAPAL